MLWFKLIISQTRVSSQNLDVREMFLGLLFHMQLKFNIIQFALRDEIGVGDV